MGPRVPRRSRRLCFGIRRSRACAAAVPAGAVGRAALPAQPRRGAAPLPHVPLRRCRCRRLCFRSRTCAAAAPDRPCWDQGGRVAQLRAHVPSGSSSERRGGGGSGGGPFNGAAVEQALPAQPRRGAAPLSTSSPAFPSGAGLGAFASGSGGAAPALPRCPQALLGGRVGGPRSRPVPEFSREKGREAGSGRKRSSPWERVLRGQRGSWGRAGRERAGGDWRGRTLPDAGIGWAGTRGAGLCGPRAINGVGGGRWGQFGGGAGGGAGAAGAGPGLARPLGRGAAVSQGGTLAAAAPGSGGESWGSTPSAADPGGAGVGPPQLKQKEDARIGTCSSFTGS
ncbi:uncharacterized protein LOC135408760 [Pseudopipra pipra]|uniref:uncharacterized protein LOC135408760 n=1 Tax=Pseudopipra pipra TaxID=415032 RepID=UPI003139A875